MSLLIGAVATVLVLNEVLYDPAGADAGREFIELWPLAPVALSGWTLEAGDGVRGTWRVVWRGEGELAAGALFVVGGDSVATAHARLGTELQNGPDAVRLVDPSGAVHDRVGYGALTDSTLFETAPAVDAASRSLARDRDGHDSDDNSRDFVVAAPTPGRRNRPRRNLTLQLQSPDPLRAWPGRLLRATMAVHNRGLDAVEGWDVVARWQPIIGSDTLRARSLAVAGRRGMLLAPGDSTRLVLGCNDGLGLYRLDVRGVFADEDSTGDHAVAAVRIGAGDVLMDEILYAPRVGELEWIELRNRGVEPLALAGWTLTDRSGRRATLRGGLRLLPGARGVVAADTTTAIAGLAAGTPRWSALPWPSLNDTGDEWADALILRDASDVLQDACGYPPAARERGRSLERVSADPDARGLNWVPSTAAGASTPGSANVVVGTPRTDAEPLDLTPNPFSPDADGIDDRVVVRCAVPPGYDGCRVEIYDLDGRRRARLLADRLGPGPRTLTWDGRDESGDIVEAGVYLCLIECHSKSSPQRSVKRAVGVVRP